MKKLRIFIFPVVALTLLAACGGGDDDEPAPSAQQQPSPTGTVTVFNAMEPEEVTALQKVVDDLINAKVQYKATIEGSAQFEEQIKIRVQGGNPPEIAMYPQPGAVLELAKQGKAVALEDMGFNIADLEKTFGSYFMSLGAHNGKHYGMPTNINLKSMIWYPKKAFDAKGYKVPATFNDLITLSDQIVRDGASPWCVGLESGSATGWPATDWMEDIMLRTAGPATYDRWVNHQIPFNDPAVVKAG
jgi:alpha-glucoside transport system substrate-binding protein